MGGNPAAVATPPSHIFLLSSVQLPSLGASTPADASQPALGDGFLFNSDPGTSKIELGPGKRWVLPPPPAASAAHARCSAPILGPRVPKVLPHLILLTLLMTRCSRPGSISYGHWYRCHPGRATHVKDSKTPSVTDSYKIRKHVESGGTSPATTTGSRGSLVAKSSLTPAASRPAILGCHGCAPPPSLLEMDGTSGGQVSPSGTTAGPVPFSRS